MTREELRLRYIVSTPDPISDILKDAFKEEDPPGAPFEEEGFFFVYAVDQDRDPDTVEAAWLSYQNYRKELALNDPVT